MNAYVLAFTDEQPPYESGSQVLLKGISSGRIYPVLTEDLIFYRPASPVLYGEDQRPAWTEENAATLRRILERRNPSQSPVPERYSPPSSPVPDRFSPPPSPVPDRSFADDDDLQLFDDDDSRPFAPQGPASLTLQLQYANQLQTSITLPRWVMSFPIAFTSAGIYSESAIDAALDFAEQQLRLANVQRVVAPMLGSQLRQNVGLVSYKRKIRKGMDLDQMRTQNPDSFSQEEQKKDLMRSENLLEARKFYVAEKSRSHGPDEGFSLQIAVESLILQYLNGERVVLMEQETVDVSNTEPLTQIALKKNASGGLYIVSYVSRADAMFSMAFVFLHKHLIGVYVWRLDLEEDEPLPQPAAPIIDGAGVLNVAFAYDDARVTMDFQNTAMANWDTDTPIVFVSKLAKQDTLELVFAAAERFLGLDRVIRHGGAGPVFNELYGVAVRFANRPVVHLVASQFYFQQKDERVQLLLSDRKLDPQNLQPIGTVESRNKSTSVLSAVFETDVNGVRYAPVFFDDKLVALYVWSTIRSKRGRVKAAIQ